MSYFPGGRNAPGINFNVQGVPYGYDVIWALCDHCGGEGVDYYDAENARECPECQGLGKKPFERPTAGGHKMQEGPWTCTSCGEENPRYMAKHCRSCLKPREEVSSGLSRVV